MSQLELLETSEARLAVELWVAAGGVYGYPSLRTLDLAWAKELYAVLEDKWAKLRCAQATGSLEVTRACAAKAFVGHFILVLSLSSDWRPGAKYTSPSDLRPVGLKEYAWDLLAGHDAWRTRKGLSPTCFDVLVGEASS